MERYLDIKLKHTKERIEVLGNYKKLYDSGKTGSEINIDIDEITQELIIEKQNMKQLSKQIAQRVKATLFRMT